MDQIKIGKFIASRRKTKALTQRELADQLNISDKTVSKWECGNGLPEVSLMLPLCELLSINVNELLSGERLDADSYKQHAEENMMNLMREREERKKKTILSAIVGFTVLLASMTLILAAGLLEMSVAMRAILLAVGLVVLLLGIAVVCVLDYEGGVFECRHCGEYFMPTMKAYIMGPHTITTRRLKCPHCGKSSYCRRRLGR